jgi:hypothetical protein
MEESPNPAPPAPYIIMMEPTKVPTFCTLELSVDFLPTFYIVLSQFLTDTNELKL